MAQSVSNDALWEKLLEIEKKIDKQQNDYLLLSDEYYRRVVELRDVQMKADSLKNMLPNHNKKKMTSIKIKFRKSTIKNKEGVVYIQLIHNRKVRLVTTRFRLYSYE